MSCVVWVGWSAHGVHYRLSWCRRDRFLLKPGSYAPSRPWERVLLPKHALAPRDGVLELVVAEPMQESCYLDDVSLITIDMPSGWEVLPG